MQKIAAIDVGSNAMRMMVGNVDETWVVAPIENIRLPVRLGADVFGSGSVGEQTILQTINAFLHFQRVAQEFGVVSIRAVGTSALREAANRDILLDRIARSSGIEVDVISGIEEARLIHTAVAHAIDLNGKRAVMIDIGGGSVEVTISEDRNIISTESYSMGTVRLLQKLDGRHQSGIQASHDQRPFSLMVREYSEAARRRIDHEIGRSRVDVCIGTGGNVEDFGRLRQRWFGKRDDSLVTIGELQDLIEELNSMSIPQRIRKLKLRPDRADVILPAAIVLQMIAREAGVRQIEIPRVGLKDGVLLELADQLRKGPHPPRREQVWESAMRLAKKYQVDVPHATLTAKLALQLFDQTTSLHGLGEEERLLLEVGSLLHDIGHFIGTIDHDKHGYYILKANPLIGLTAPQQEIVANLVLHHRKGASSLEDDPSKGLSPRERSTVGKLSALLRLADGLDVSHASHITGAVLAETKKKHWQLTLQGHGDLMIEKWALNKRRDLFEGTFGVPLDIQDARA